MSRNPSRNKNTKHVFKNYIYNFQNGALFFKILVVEVDDKFKETSR